MTADEPAGPAPAPQPAGTTRHDPVPPAWTCTGCGADWPCETRRAQLLAEFDGIPVSLSVHLSTYFVYATEDLPHLTVGQLYSRFIGWTPRR